MLTAFREHANRSRMLVIGGLVGSWLALSGCGASEETMPEQPSSEVLAYQKQIEDLKTENTSLKQRVLKMEQDNRNLEARVSDLETKLMAERERAEKAIEAARTTARSVTMPPKPPADALTAYEEALRAFNEKKYDEALRRLEALQQAGVSDELGDNVHYWMGESQFGKKKFPDALKHFEAVFGYKDSEKLADAYFMSAQCHERLGDKAKAKEAYQKVVNDFPTSPKVLVAKERSAKL